MQTLFVSKDEGNALAGTHVAREFSIRGHTITYCLDPGGAARKTYDRDDVFRRFFHGFDVPGPDYALREDTLRKFQLVFVTLSASGLPNAEGDVVDAAERAGISCYGLEEVPGGRNNPGWGDGVSEPLTKLRRLFAAFPAGEGDQSPNVTVVGPPQLEVYRGKDWDAMGAEARRKLDIPPDAPIVFYTGHPEPESPPVLYDLGKALRSLGVTSNVVLVVARHGRELTTAIPGNSVVHRHALRLIARNAGIRVIENSLGHMNLEPDHPDAIPKEFRPKEFATYQELVCACRHDGAVVTGFGTDGFLAGFLEVPAILYLDPFLLGALAQREKGVEHFPLAVSLQPDNAEDFVWTINEVLCNSASRLEHIQRLRAAYPFPEKNPADRIAETILSDVAATA